MNRKEDEERSLLMSQVGIVVNPMAGKDVRRIIGYASSVGAIEKVEILRRIFAGLAHFNVNKIYFMPDPENFAERTLVSLHKRDFERIREKVVVLDFPTLGTAADSKRAASMMEDLGVACIVVLGGDGTCKSVASGCRKTPLLPVSTGTNNVFPYRIDGTVAGLAAGAYATQSAGFRRPVPEANMFHVYVNGRLVNHALVDVVLYNEPFVSARAMWEPEKVLYVAISGHFREPVIGMASIAQIAKGKSRYRAAGLACVINPQKPKAYIVSPIAPGLMCEMPISKSEDIFPGRRYRITTDLSHKWCTLAVDGERENEIDMSRDLVEIELVEKAVPVIDPFKVYENALEHRLFHRM